MSRLPLAGREVPIIGSDSTKWFNLYLPHSPSTSPSPQLLHIAPPLTKDASSCCNVGDPPNYFIWRINKTCPNVLEIVEFCTLSEFPRVGLRIHFPTPLSPFAFICKHKLSSTSGKPYMLYTLSVSGVAYLIRLTDIDNYGSCSVFPLVDVVELNIQSYCDYGGITAVAATAGCLVIGGSDGSVACFRLSMLDSSAPSSLHELRDDLSSDHSGSLMSGSTVAPVMDMVCLEIQGRKTLLVLHLDGILRVWDLVSCTRLLNYSMNVSAVEGATFTRLWAGESTDDTRILPLAVLHNSNSVVGWERISLYNLQLNLGGMTSFIIMPSTINIPMPQGMLIDVKLFSNKIWVLDAELLALHSLSDSSESRVSREVYSLQNTVVANQLFQDEHAADDLLLLAYALYPSAKEQIVSRVSSIFLRMLFSPGVYHSYVIRATLQDHNIHFTDSEFNSLTVDGLQKEIISVIEHEGSSRSLLSLLDCWRNFCSHYYDNWCHQNAPCALLLDSATGAIGLVRKSSVSLLRHFEDIELLIVESQDALGQIPRSRLNLSGDVEIRILSEVLQCATRLSHHLGNGVSALLRESFFSEPCVSPEDVVGRLLRVLESGYSSSITALHVSELGVDTAWKKRVGDHKILRKFSIDILLLLKGLYRIAGTWDKVFKVILDYLNVLVPRKDENKSTSDAVFDLRTCITVQITSQVANIIFESAVDILLLLSYMVKLAGQIDMLPDDISMVQLVLYPLIHEIITKWHLIHFFGTTPCVSTLEDFSSRSFLLQIDSSAQRISWKDKFGKRDFTLAFILLLDHQSSFEDQGVNLKHLPNPASFIAPVQKFISWIVWGRSEDEPSFSARSSMLALTLLKHGQIDAVEHLLTLVNQNLLERATASIQGVNNDWCTLLHLLGCCLLAQAHREPLHASTEKKHNEAISCFFRVASLHGASKSFQNLPYESGSPHLGFSYNVSPGAWKFHYYQWAMQIFDQYNMSAGACQFAFATLEQVDEVFSLKDTFPGVHLPNESPITAKGRIWANVYKFKLDLNCYHDAYGAIISNPDEESKYSCLRHFISVLFERGSLKILCDGQLPFIGSAEKVEQELIRKAKHSDVSVKSNPYKLLYAFEMHQHNWRKAASYMYLSSSQLKSEAGLKNNQARSLALQERLNCISATINALHLVHPTCAWINNFLVQEKSIHKELYTSKMARITIPEEANDCPASEKLDSCLDIEKLEKEFVLTSAEYCLSLANIKWTFTGIEKPDPNLVELLVESNLYDMVFTVILKFYKGSALKRELERVFIAMTLKCCPSRESSKKHRLLLASSKDEGACVSVDLVAAAHANHSKGNDKWDALEQYTEKYHCLHPGLPVIVAETLLCADRRIKLPLWLVQKFKSTQKECWGMAGSESSPALLFQLYVDYGRYAEATNLLLRYIESAALVRPADVIRGKKTSAVWFPYTAIERLWCKLGELIGSGHMVGQCEKLRSLLERALSEHFQQRQVNRSREEHRLKCEVDSGN
uniref:nuclear pore complex protein NUP160-like n=1 Tax=Erigeron canadensis TaxID=72917 RepID=UPI001CB8F63F|nr:nuclear pore complex protein NUP160-like [Erigeron canadensis]